MHNFCVVFFKAQIYKPVVYGNRLFCKCVLRGAARIRKIQPYNTAAASVYGDKFPAGIDNITVDIVQMNAGKKSNVAKKSRMRRQMQTVYVRSVPCAFPYNGRLAR